MIKEILQSLSKKILTLVIGLVFITACSSEGSGSCSYNGHSLKKGPEGGCYYINSNGNKEYVDRSNCNC